MYTVAHLCRCPIKRRVIYESELFHVYLLTDLLTYLPTINFICILFLSRRQWAEMSFQYYRVLITGPEAGDAGVIMQTGVFLTKQPYEVIKDYL